ncbi:Uncharacterized protein dnl_61460 [Desulfonema limicola]|uniref:Uncharacterized protein n=1 Tax=Desulfonema limicola TaxID=45656 RepID=A0A975BE13_9BACT|nr:hypothetical protein [Desulfonema limicola]QTA83731.1 Uncharacterized protein dnl_61460 [Desulfonema limicola]
MREKADVLKDIWSQIDTIAQVLSQDQDQKTVRNEQIEDLIDKGISKWLENLDTAPFSKDNVNSIKSKSVEILGAMKKCKIAKSQWHLCQNLTNFIEEQFIKKNKFIDSTIVSLLFVLLSFKYHDEILGKEYAGSKDSVSKKTPDEKYTLTFAIPAKEIEFKERIKKEGGLTPDMAGILVKIKQWILYTSENEWKDKCGELFKNPAKEKDDHDVYYIMIMLNKPDDRFGKNSNMIKMYDALTELAKTKPEVKISERQPKESYENKGFYRV